MNSLTLPLAGSPAGTPAGVLGTNAGANSDGILLGELTPFDPTFALLASHAEAVLAYADDGGAYTDETTPANEATADDMTLLPATPAQEDAYYIAHATKKFARWDVNLTTDGNGTWTVVHEYWNGSAWTAHAGVTDGTSGFVAGSTGWKSVTYTMPTDWQKCLVDGVLGYWSRARVSAYTSVITAPVGGQAYVVVDTSEPTFTDDTTDFTDAGAGDVALLPAYPVLHDAFYLVGSEKYCKVKVTTSQARTGTATIAAEYWNGSAWAAIPGVADDTAGWSTTAGALLVHFEPPSDWAANTAANGPNGKAGWCVRFRLSAITDVTQQPLATIGSLLPLVTDAQGIQAPTGGTKTIYRQVSGSAGVKSAANADSKFLIINATSGVHKVATWPKGKSAFSAALELTVDPGDELVVAQIQEDGTTELAGASLWLTARS